ITVGRVPSRGVPSTFRIFSQLHYYILRSSIITSILALWALALFPAPSAFSQEWPHYGNDLAGTKYSPLDQINRENVKQLAVAWTYHTGDVSDGNVYLVRSSFECTPLVLNGVMYLTTPFSRLIALEAETGKPLWSFDPQIDKSRPYNLFVNRGVALWQRGKFPRRLYGLTSPPLVYKDLVIVGSVVPDATPQGPSGDVRAFDAVTGKIVWRFHTVPHPGEFGNETWEKDAWQERGGTNAWSIMSCDEERGILFLPLTSPSPDRYGGERKGQNLFGDSLVALDAHTGRRLWHYQIVHHDLWDWDLPAQPNLVKLIRNGKAIPAVAQITKMGFLFVFDRLTGTPLFEIEERRFPPSDVPGEQAWPTQPFPVKPPPVARQTMTRDEVTDVTPESRAECLKILEDAEIGEFYQPQK